MFCLVSSAVVTLAVTVVLFKIDYVNIQDVLDESWSVAYYGTNVTQDALYVIELDVRSRLLI